MAESLAALDQDEEDIMSDQISILTAMSEDSYEEENIISSSDWTDVEILQWGEWMPQKNHSTEDIQHNMNQKSLKTQGSELDDKEEDKSSDQTSTQSTLSQPMVLGLPNVKQKKSLPIGVHETTAGNYHVKVWYQGKDRSIGTFQTLEQATLANRIAWGMLKKDKGLQLSSEECERNFKLAKETALADVPDTSKVSKIPGSGAWTDTEQQQFKQVCILFGWGNWKDVDRVV